MALPIVFNNTSFGAGQVGQDDGAPAATFGYDDFSGSPIVVNGTVTGVGSQVTATGIFPGESTSTTKTLYATQFDNPTMIQFNDGAGPTYTRANNRYVFSNRNISGDASFTADGNGTVGDYAVCFVTGTGIRVVRDGIEADVAVERLQVGDLAVTADGARRPIRWIGSRTVTCAGHPHPDTVLPVRIAAHAFGEGRPARDLVVSPGHALAVTMLDEVLIPAVNLVNGATITQEPIDAVTYWHVELDSHDLLLAEGLAAESYLDLGNRAFFAGGGVVSLYALPDAAKAVRDHADFCRPFHAGGVIVEAVRAQLHRRAQTMGWRLVGAEPWADAYLEVDGRIVRPDRHGLTARFVVPASAREVWLVSPAGVSRFVEQTTDLRPLGLCLQRLHLDHGLDAPRAVAMDDPRLDVGFYPAEFDHRWTNGRARLPADLWAGLTGAVVLRMDLQRAGMPVWTAPETEASVAVPAALAA